MPISQYNYTLVAISFLIAVFGSYIAILIVSDLKKYPEKKIYLDFLGGAFAMGAGIFSLHFIALLADTFLFQVKYNLWITLSSLFTAIIASALAFYFVAIKNRGWPSLLIGGIALGSGIVSTHYLEMKAIVGVESSFLFRPFIISILVSTLSSLAALFLMLKCQKLHGTLQRVIAFVGAIILSAGAFGTHYTAVNVTNFTSTPAAETFLINKLELSFLLAIVASLIMMAALFFRGLRAHIFFHLLIGYVAILFLMIPLAFISITGIEKINYSTEKITLFIFPRIESLLIMKGIAREIQILSKKPELQSSEVKAALEENLSQLHFWKKSYENALHKDDAIKSKQKILEKILQKMHTLITSGQSQDLLNTVNELIGFLNELISSEFEIRKDQLNTIQMVAKDTIRLSLLLLGIAIALALIISFYESNYFSKGFQRLKTLTEHVTEGDLNYRAPVVSGDELARLTESFNSMVDALAASKQTQREFMSIAAHDLRNPLSVIMEGSSIIPSLGNLTKKQEKIVSVIYTASDSMLLLINDLLSINTFEANAFIINRQEVDIRKFAQEIFELNDLLAKRKSIKFHFSLDLKKEKGFFDKDKITQVVNNFLSNAFKFSKPESTVLLLIKDDLSKLRIEVHDEAGGIPYDEQFKVFTKFCKISVKPTGGESSTGLGLAICKDIIDTHLGQIGFTSTPGRGSTFYLEIDIGKQNSEKKEI